MRTLYKIIIVLAILFVSFEIGIAIPGSFIYALITLIILQESLTTSFQFTMT